MRFNTTLSVLVVFMTAISSCTGSEEAKPQAQSKAGDSSTPSVIEAGKKLYDDQVCKTCHSTDASPLIGPTFKGLYGSKVELTSGASVIADEAYLIESMILPNAKIVKGFPPVMPSYKDRLTNDQMNAIVAYIKTLK